MKKLLNMIKLFNGIYKSKRLTINAAHAAFGHIRNYYR